MAGHYFNRPHRVRLSARKTVLVTKKKEEWMKKTRLMVLAERYGDTGAGALNPRTIDAIVYQITEMGETAFGPKFTEALEDEVSLTEASYPKNKALEFLTSEFMRKYLSRSMTNHHIAQGTNFSALPPLNKDTYVDYFMAITTLDRHTNKTPLQQTTFNIHAVLTGYSTESSYPVCEGIVNFFKDMKDEVSLYLLIKTLCEKIKLESKLS